MTVVFALVCADGVVVASDTQVTDSGRMISYPAQKLHPLGDDAVWGGSGARSVLQDLEHLFEHEAGGILEAEDVGRAIQQRTIPVLRYHYEHFIEEVPGEETPGTPSAYVLAAGYRDGEPWIIEINPNGMLSRYEAIGFHAVGGGAPMALQAGTLLAHFQMQRRPVRYGVVAAVRVLEALTLSSPRVGAPINLCRIDGDGRHMFDDAEIDDARKQAERWREAEQGVLDDLFD